MSDGPPVCGEGMTGSRPTEEPTTATILPWHGRTLSSFTLYGELCIACTPEEFALVRTRLQQEWSLAGGFVSRQLQLCFLTPSSFITQHIAHRYCCVSSLSYDSDSVR